MCLSVNRISYEVKKKKVGIWEVNFNQVSMFAHTLTGSHHSGHYQIDKCF